MVPFSARHHLAPDFRWQGVFTRRGRVPAGAGWHVVDSGGDVGGQVMLGAFFDGIVDVAIGIIDEQLPYGGGVGIRRRFKRDGTLFSRRIEKERNDCVFADVFGNVLFGVVGAHLLLVDVFFEDVAEYIGIDLVIVFQRSVVKVHW